MKKKMVALLLVVTLSFAGIMPVTAATTSKCKSVPTKVKLNRKKATITVHQTVKFVLKKAKAKQVKWKSSDSSIATVSRKGLVTGKKKGIVTITAKYKKKKYKATVKVKKALTVTTVNANGSSLKQGIYLLDDLYEGENIIVSPFSLNMALGMVANGTTPSAKSDCETYLGKTVEQFNKDSLQWMEKAKKDDAISLANGVWYEKGYKVKEAFKNAVENNYLATVKETGMDQNTIDEVNQWASDNTDGMIKRVIKEIQPRTVAILSNALLFKGNWTDKFYEGATEKEDFTDAKGVRKKVDMMHSTEHAYYENDYARAFEKTYENGRYSFIGILPKEQGDFSLQNLDIEGLLKTRTTQYGVKIGLPKFSYEWNNSLNDTLMKTPLKSVYDMAANPLGEMLYTADPIYVSDIRQSCKISVDEKGTVAAAVTTVIVKDGAMFTKEYKTINMNRPFGYLIKDNTTNEVLFMGKVVEINS